MRRSVLRILGAAAVVIATAQGGRAQLADQIADQVKNGVPVVGADIGAAIPVSNYQKTAGPGGAIAPFVGYQIGDEFTFTPILQPQFAGFSSCCGDDVASITSLTGGARFSLNDGPAEAYFGAQGGYYWHTTGPLNGNGAGWNIQGGVNYEFWSGTALGLFIAYHEASMRPAKNVDSNTTTFLVTGLEVRHRFLRPPPAPPPVVAEAPPPPAPVKKKIVLRGVNFDFDRYDIRPDASPILDEAANTLQEYGDVTILVDGYTDAIGSEAYNQRLSERRANAVKQYLERRGVAGSRMTPRGFGKSNPVATNDTPEGRAQNRRVELIVNNQ
jgi:outer membrane protein OmpA-like peptidoglycan-associated protein